ncbi:MAG TPA: hypothetical protein VIK78_21140 [Ruminiclostridium sp.]
MDSKYGERYKFNVVKEFNPIVHTIIPDPQNPDVYKNLFKIFINALQVHIQQRQLRIWL